LGWETPFSDVQPSLDPVYQNGSTAMITWQPDVDTTQISSSNQTITNYITSFATAVKNYGHTIFIRPMHEMNGNWYKWGIGDSSVNTNQTYISAWQYIVNIFRQPPPAGVGATNASFVWCINDGNVGKGSSYTGAYPGDSYVDYTAIDGYNWGTTQSWSSWQSFSSVFSSSYNALKGLTQKPILLTEWASTETGGDKAAWITNAFQQITAGNFPQIAGLVWFNVNKETDWRIESSTTAQQAYYQAVHNQ
jgi:beta-mannanase